MTPVASHTPSSITIGAEHSRLVRRWTGSSGWLGVARADLDVLTDPHLGRVEDDRAEVDERPGADVDPVAVVAMKRRHDLGPRTEGAEQRAKDLLPGERVVG
jgi:hypothetical protein